MYRMPRKVATASQADATRTIETTTLSRGS
jgi:hypothetical protein